MQFSPFSRHLIPLRSKYPPQHPALKHPQSMFSYFPLSFITSSLSLHVRSLSSSHAYYSFIFYLLILQERKREFFPPHITWDFFLCVEVSSFVGPVLRAP
jgi:hypothetical protein